MSVVIASRAGGMHKRVMRVARTTLVQHCRRAAVGGAGRFSGTRMIHASTRLLDIKEFKLADIGEGIAEVEVLQWYVKPGDTVQEFDNICEVQSDKATVDITSRYAGVVQGLKWDVGDMAKVGSTLVEIEVEGGDKSSSKQDRAAAAVAAEEETAAKDAQTEVEELILTQPTSALKRMGSFSVDPILRPPQDDFPDEPSQSASNAERSIATPAVRRLVRDHNLDLLDIPPSGKAGRVLKGDVLAYLARVPFEERQRQSRERENAKTAAVQHQQEPHVSVEMAVTDDAKPVGVSVAQQRLFEDKVVPVAGIQRIMVKSMDASLKVPHFNFMEEYGLDGLVTFREQMKSVAEGRGLKLTYMPIFLKAMSMALTQFPQLNAHFLSDEMKVVQKASHNLGVAMDTPRGLLVPVIKDCQNKSILQIAEVLADMQAKGMANKLGEADLTGGTFTLSNIGAIGGTYASPIIPVPTVMIGAMGRMQTIPKFIDESKPELGVVPQKTMNISWAADHRVVDGATVARFSNVLKDYLGNPLSMMSDLS